MAPIAFAVRRRSSGARLHRYPARYPASKASPAPMGSTSTAGKAGCPRISPPPRTRRPPPAAERPPRPDGAPPPRGEGGLLQDLAPDQDQTSPLSPLEYHLLRSPPLG